MHTHIHLCTCMLTHTHICTYDAHSAPPQLLQCHCACWLFSSALSSLYDFSICCSQALSVLGTLSLHLRLLAHVLSTFTLPILQPLPWAPFSTASCGQLALNLLTPSCPVPTPNSTTTHSEHRQQHIVGFSSDTLNLFLSPLSMVCP